MKQHPLKNSIKYFFTYTKGERNGTIVLAIILLLLITTSVFLHDIISPKPVSDPATYEKIDSFFNSLEYIEPDKKVFVDHSILHEELPLPKQAKEFYFNPNTVSVDSLVDLGLSPKQAQVVINYRSKGGKFRTPDDLSKIHVIDSGTFRRLKPWIQIPATTNAYIDSVKALGAASKILIELNSADSISLTMLKGIGRSFARRIVAYRNLLGGFYTTNQLNEVYGLSPDVIHSILPNVWIDSTAIKSINLNLVTYEDLKKHPYLTDYQAKSIIYYRSKRGTIGSAVELLENKIIPNDRFDKLKHYFATK